MFAHTYRTLLFMGDGEVCEVRRLRDADFLDAFRRRQGERHPAEWWVGEYEWRANTLVDATSRALQWKSYRPLEEAKDLFLSFARLYEAEDFASSAKEWVDRFGLPIEFFYEDIFGESSFSSILADQYARELAGKGRTRAELEKNWQVGSEVGWYKSGKNPPSMTLEDLRAEAWTAWDALAHYEAYINNAVGLVLYRPSGEAHPQYMHLIDRLPEQRVSEIVLGQAKQTAESAVTEKVNEYCFLTSLPEEYSEGPQSKWAWGFHDLRGAMYLQMLWVMERGVPVGKYCKLCNKSIRMTGPKGNKSPKRKEFCNNACRVAYSRARKA